MARCVTSSCGSGWRRDGADAREHSERWCPASAAVSAAGPSRRRRRVAGAVVVCTVLGGSVVGAGLGAQEDDPERTPLVLGECPENSTELPRSAVAWASLAALRQAHHVYSQKDRDGMYVERAYLATDASDRGEGAKRQCGETVQQRTVAGPSRSCTSRAITRDGGRLRGCAAVRLRAVGSGRSQADTELARPAGHDPPPRRRSLEGQPSARRQRL